MPTARGPQFWGWVVHNFHYGLILRHKKLKGLGTFSMWCVWSLEERLISRHRTGPWCQDMAGSVVMLPTLEGVSGVSGVSFLGRGFCDAQTVVSGVWTLCPGSTASCPSRPPYLAGPSSCSAPRTTQQRGQTALPPKCAFPPPLHSCWPLPRSPSSPLTARSQGLVQMPPPVSHLPMSLCQGSSPPPKPCVPAAACPHLRQEGQVVPDCSWASVVSGLPGETSACILCGLLSLPWWLVHTAWGVAGALKVLSTACPGEVGGVGRRKVVGKAWASEGRFGRDSKLSPCPWMWSPHLSVCP